jgi:hypothetical protein
MYTYERTSESMHGTVARELKKKKLRKIHFHMFGHISCLCPIGSGQSKYGFVEEVSPQ